MLLIGDGAKIKQMMHEKKLSMDVEIINADSMSHAAKTAVACVHQGKASMLVKGNVDTATLLKAVLSRNDGLRKEPLLSHVSITELDDRMLVFGDGAMNIAPSLHDKRVIIDQCCEVAKACGLPYIHVGVLCAVEKISDKMPCTQDAVLLKTMEYAYPDVVVGGPFALDNALSIKAAKTKQINSPIAGDVNVLLMPNIEAGNVFYKTLSFVAKKEVAGVVMGATVPIALTSRADSFLNKINAILLGCVIASQPKKR